MEVHLVVVLRAGDQLNYVRVNNFRDREIHTEFLGVFSVRDVSVRIASTAALVGVQKRTETRRNLAEKGNVRGRDEVDENTWESELDVIQNELQELEVREKQ